MAGDKLDSFQELKGLGESYSISKGVKEAEQDLIKKLWSLQENGCTALGPALMLSILIAVCFIFVIFAFINIFLGCQTCQ